MRRPITGHDRGNEADERYRAGGRLYPSADPAPVGGETSPKTCNSPIRTSFNNDNVILDKPESPSLQSTLGERIAVHHHGGLIK